VHPYEGNRRKERIYCGKIEVRLTAPAGPDICPASPVRECHTSSTRFGAVAAVQKCRPILATLLVMPGGGFIFMRPSCIDAVLVIRYTVYKKIS
jgi:hypothetical protein